jgi:hypothetical protein
MGAAGSDTAEVADIALMNDKLPLCRFIVSVKKRY